MNLNFSLSRLVEEGKKMRELYGPGFTGIDNIGNSCYMNSVLQTLFSLPEYVEQYGDNKSKEHVKACTRIPTECFYCQISKVGLGLTSGKYAQRLIRHQVINGVEV